MKALREIKTVHKQRVLVELPASFTSRRVGVLVFPIADDRGKLDSSERFMRFVKDNTFKLPVSYRFNREELHER